MHDFESTHEILGAKRQPSAQRLYDSFNTRYFRGRLERFTVRKDRKAGAPNFCDIENRRIHLPEDDVPAALIHEMVHVLTAGLHDDAF